MPRNFKIQRSATASATGASIKQKILQWCQNKTRKYEVSLKQSLQPMHQIYRSVIKICGLMDLVWIAL